MSGPALYVDADACPVKAEVLRVAERHQLRVHMVSNSGVRQALHPLVNSVVVSGSFDAADDWIAAEAGDIVPHPFQASDQITQATVGRGIGDPAESVEPEPVRQ